MIDMDKEESNDRLGLKHEMKNNGAHLPTADESHFILT